MFRRGLKLFAYGLIRALGGFRLARHLTRNKLRILCYHGFSVGDEYRYMPIMFMRGETFGKRLESLRKLRIPVISLDEAVARLQGQGFGNAETVITLDDGWATNLTIAAPLLRRYGYASTIYLTTEHLAAGTEVFDVVLSYMCLTATTRQFTLEGVHPAIDGSYSLVPDPQATADRICDLVEKLPIRARQQMLPEIARAMGLDYRAVVDKERFQLLTGSQMIDAERSGFALELHTHTHRLPADSFEGTRREIDENRRCLQELLGHAPRHFCYPSGRYGAEHPQWLRKLGVASATTCEPGLNDVSTDSCLLARHLDRDDDSSLEFEAALSGLPELLRGIFRSRP